MSNKHRVQKLENRSNTREELIQEITINIVNADGTSGGTLVSKQVNGIWSGCEKQ